MRVRELGTVFIIGALSLAGCSGSEESGDAGAGCDLDACSAHCLGDGGGVAACVSDECLCFPLPRDGGEDEGGGANHG